MKYLVGDIGNTLTKIALINSNFKIKEFYNIETKKLKILRNRVIFFKKFKSQKLNNVVLFSSVVPTIYNTIKNDLKKKKFRVIEVKKLNLKKLIKFKVDDEKQLGSDRIANAIGSYNIYKKDCLVIDFGTATTFDIIKKPGIYCGGVIAPGVKLSIVNLNKFTALLPVLKLKKVKKSYGKNTKDALNSGFLWGYQGLINNIIKKIFLGSKTNYKIILTGGYANFFKNYISKKTTIDKNITIKGIIRIYKELVLWQKKNLFFAH